MMQGIPKTSRGTHVATTSSTLLEGTQRVTRKKRTNELWRSDVGQLDNTERHGGWTWAIGPQPWVSHVDGSAYIDTTISVTAWKEGCH